MRVVSVNEKKAKLSSYEHFKLSGTRRFSKLTLQHLVFTFGVFHFKTKKKKKTSLFLDLSEN